MRNILFVCSGNTCRSPLCEVLGNKLLPSFSFSSRALSGFSGDSASEGSIDAARRHSLDLSSHRSRVLSVEDIDKADEIICMTESHKAILSNILERLSIKKDVTVLGGGIPDPFMGDSEVYENCYNLIKNAIIFHFFGLEIAPISKEDISYLHLLEVNIFSIPWSEQAFSEFLENENNFGLVAKKNGKIVGYITGSSVLGEAEIYNIAVTLEERGKGIGRLLLLEFEDRLTPKEIVLEVRKSNEGAIRLYEKLGYKTISERKNFYENPREDALMMKKER